MSYCPPHQRKARSAASRPSVSKPMVSKPTVSRTTQVPDMINDFPLLEKMNDLDNIHTMDTMDTMDYLSSMFNTEEDILEDITPIVSPNVPDGWAHITKKKINYGNVSKKYFEFHHELDKMNDSKKNVILNKMLNRVYEYEELDYIKNGPSYMYGWEIEPYFKELEEERKQELRELEESTDESDDDHITMYD